MMDNIFSLLDEPWVQVIYKDGRPAEIPLRQVFSDAANIKELSGDIPQQKFPLIRLFLAILYRAYCVINTDADQMRELWKEIFFSSRHFSSEIMGRYFDKWEDRFYLIGERPFFQVPDLEYASQKPYSPVSEIIADVPKPDKFLFSMRSMDAVDSLSFAEASRWLMFMQHMTLRESKRQYKATHMSVGEKCVLPKACSKPDG